MKVPFRRARQACERAGGDWDLFGYRVSRNGLTGKQEQSCVDPAGGLELARGVFAVAVDGRRLDPQTPGDLLGVHMGMDEPEAFALAVCQMI
jgi:hypothetical protein